MLTKEQKVEQLVALFLKIHLTMEGAYPEPKKEGEFKIVAGYVVDAAEILFK